MDPPNARAAAVLDLFGRISDRTAAAVRANRDWSESGVRPSQYAIDLDVDAICVAPLVDAGYSVLSEESGSRETTGASGTVVVDPLDGSTNASLGLPWFNTALCLVDGDGPQIAMVTNLATGDRYTAARGGGARRNGQPIRVADPVDLSDAIVAVNGWPPRHWGWRQFRALGSAALDICSVAGGAFDAYIDATGGELGVWDFLAAQLIVEEAGGVAADARGRDLRTLDYDARRAPVLASHPALLARLLGEVGARGPQPGGV